MKQLIAKENPWLILFAVSVGLLMAVFGIAIVNIILPVIAEMLDASLAGVQWILISYLLVMIGLVPTFGRISDVIGRKRLFVGGIFVIAGASVLAAMSGSVAWLIAARAIQGIGGAMITSNALAIIADTFPAGKRGAAMGVQAILISGGVAIAPTFGGFLATNFGWEWVFLFNVPMALIAALIAWLVLPPLKSHRTREPIDWVGAAALFGAL
ncbi:MAG: MFS transporter, partial [Dehalococcoidia bacterium]